MFGSKCHAHKAVANETEASSSEYKLIIKCSISNTDQVNEDKSLIVPSSELMKIMSTTDKKQMHFWLLGGEKQEPEIHLHSRVINKVAAGMWKVHF